MSDQAFNSGTVQDPLGDFKTGLSPDLDALATYVESLTEVRASPYRNPNGSLTADAETGKVIFEELQCASCHVGNKFTDSALDLFHDVGTIKTTSGQRLGQPLTGLDTPTLKGAWETAPYLHDGSASSLMDVITTANTNDEHGVTSTLSQAEREQLVAYLSQIDELEIVVPEPPRGEVSFEQIETGGSTSSITVTTSGNMTAANGALYLVAVTSKSFRSVITVTGLGLTWSPVLAQCGGRNATGVTVWMAQGSPIGPGPVTATLSGAPSNAVIAVSRYSGADQTNPIGNIVSVNSNGVSGGCSGGTDGNAYSFNLSTTASGSLVVGAIAMRNRNHTPGAGYTEQVEFALGIGGDVASVATMDRTVASPSSVTVDGIFSSTVDYAVIGVEIKPGPGGGPAPIDVPDVTNQLQTTAESTLITANLSVAR